MKLEGAKDGLLKARTELMEAHRELQECAQEQDKRRKEALDLRRLMADGTRETEAVQASNQELRALIKRAESDNNRYVTWNCRCFFYSLYFLSVFIRNGDFVFRTL